jgi:tRNA-specific 2-thiouridylase
MFLIYGPERSCQEDNKKSENLAKQPRVLVALSGGVDSAVSAHLLSKEGYELLAATMILLPCVGAGEPARPNCCCGEQSISAARRISAQLGIPHSLVDLADEFEKQIISRFLSEYSRARTPNPCVWCNREIKFGLLNQKSRALGCDTVATGHYAKVEKDALTGKFLLKKGKDSKKDQSYFLFSLTQEQLSNTLFPLAPLTKTEVREIAKEAGISAFNARESQDICFVPGNDCTQFLRERLGGALIPGNFRDSSGKVLGMHGGIQLYTVGQRRRLGIAKGEPLYVLKIDSQTNEIILGPKEELYATSLTASEVNWIGFDQPPAEIRCCARIRYSHKEAPATVRRISEDSVEVKFDEPQMAITPGQAVVFYDEDRVLGGATILDSRQ